MKKLKNEGKSFAVTLHDNKAYDWVNGEVVSVPDNFMSQLKDHIAKLKDVTGPPTIKIINEYGKVEVVPLKKLKKKEPKKEIKVKWTKEDLLGLPFGELRKVGDSLGVKFRGRKEGIKEILEAQE